MDYIHFVMIASIFIGLLTGAFGSAILIFRKVDALLGVDTSDPEKDKYKFVVLCPLEDLRKKKYLIVEVKQR